MEDPRGLDSSRSETSWSSNTAENISWLRKEMGRLCTIRTLPRWLSFCISVITLGHIKSGSDGVRVGGNQLTPTTTRRYWVANGMALAALG